MKITTRLTITAIAALLPLASPAFAGDKVGETADYNIIRINVSGNGQPAIVYVRKEPTVAINVRGNSVGSCPSAACNRQLQSRDNGHGQSVFQYVQGGIN